MDTDSTIDSHIAAEVERLRAEFTDTQALYREVCVVLFFRYGITPTANKLYQLVRRGSMSAPAEALRVFWEDLRAKSRVRIEHPDLPEAIRDAAGELVATLWTQAQTSATESLASLRADASLEVSQAQTARAATENEKLHVQGELKKAHQQFQEAQDRSLNLERMLATEKANKEAVAAQLETAGRQHRVLEVALAEARKEFTAELGKLREALNRTEERLQGSEKRALLEIDRERTLSGRLQHELQQLRQSNQDLLDRHQAEIREFQERISEFTKKLGQADGILQSQKETLKENAAQLLSMRAALSDGETRRALMGREVEVKEKRISELESELVRLNTLVSTKSAPRRRKNKFD